tara:strand:+ start:569 stop:898 length:330 start_codon:yes stop_codon:yes gene_type:complete
MNQTQIACETQSAILAVFKDFFKEELGQDSGNHIHATKADKIVCENVIPAEDDAGEWAPSAHAIIYHVNGMPSIDHIEKWGKVSDMLESDKQWLYVEAINPEVSAVFSL